MSVEPILIYKFSKKTNVKKAFALIKERFPVEHMGETLFIDTKNPVFVFHTGIVVSWNNTEFIQFIKKNKRSLFSELLEKPIREKLSFCNSNKFEIKEDTIYLHSTNDNLLFVLSYAIAQSLQLEIAEQHIAEMFTITQELPTQLATHGKVLYSAKDIKKQIGNLLLFEHEMSSAFISIEKPDITWELPELESSYNALSGYLELKERSKLVSKKIGFLQNTMDILRDESNTHHSAVLEWIVIILILFETILFMGELLTR